MKLFEWLAEQALDGVLYYWPVSAILVGLLCAALATDISKRRLRATDMGHLLCPLFGTAVMLCMGAFLERTEYLIFLPLLGLASCLILAVVSVIKLRRVWMTASTVSLLILWYSLWCVLVSGMSITGDWM